MKNPLNFPGRNFNVPGKCSTIDCYEWLHSELLDERPLATGWPEDGSGVKLNFHASGSRVAGTFVVPAHSSRCSTLVAAFLHTMVLQHLSHLRFFTLCSYFYSSWLQHVDRFMRRDQYGYPNNKGNNQLPKKKTKKRMLRKARRYVE